MAELDSFNIKLKLSNKNCPLGFVECLAEGSGHGEVNMLASWRWIASSVPWSGPEGPAALLGPGWRQF